MSSARARLPDETREQVLSRDQGRCTSCGEPVASNSAHIHHVMPVALGGSDELANLTTLCAGCHAATHPLLQIRLSRRIIERWAWRLARWLDRDLRPIGYKGEQLGAALRLFQLQRLRAGQLDIVLAALEGKPLLMVSPTGSGKSLCFQLPAIMSTRTAIVISPLKALMTDQVSGLQRRKIPATFVNSDLDPDEKRLRYELLEKNAFKLLYCAPERFDESVVRPEESTRLNALRPSYMVVDEAHCIDKWGDAFRPSYSDLGAVAKRLGSPPILAFTATATIPTQKRILASLKIEGAQVFVRNVDRPNIAFLRMSTAGDADKFEHLARLLRMRRIGCAMIFVPTVRVGQTVSNELKANGIEAPLYHAKLPPAEREFLLKRFLREMQPSIDAIVCTNAFGMGLDVPDVRLVVHWQHPASIEDYLQEFGRAGRDGKQSLAVLFRTKDDRGLPRYMIDKTIAGAQLATSEREAVRGQKFAALDDVHGLAQTEAACFRQALLRHFQGKVSKRISLGKRLLSWVFSERSRAPKQRFCCDVCARLGNSETRVLWAQRVLRR